MIRFLLVFVALTVGTTIALSFLNVPFGTGNYWDLHGVFLLGFLTFFPRLALLFSSIPFGGLFWWLGWFFCPHYLVAILATLTYWQRNPILVTIAWCVALGAETTEKYYIRRTVVRKHADAIDVEARDLGSTQLK